MGVFLSLKTGVLSCVTDFVGSKYSVDCGSPVTDFFVSLKLHFSVIFPFLRRWTVYIFLVFLFVYCTGALLCQFPAFNWELWMKQFWEDLQVWCWLHGSGGSRFTWRSEGGWFKHFDSYTWRKTFHFEGFKTAMGKASQCSSFSIQKCDDLFYKVFFGTEHTVEFALTNGPWNFKNNLVLVRPRTWGNLETDLCLNRAILWR